MALPEGSDAAYRDMTSFIATVTDRRLAEQLERAVQAEVRSVASATRCPAPTTSSPDGIASLLTASEDEPEPGSLIAATNPDRGHSSRPA